MERHTLVGLALVLAPLCAQEERAIEWTQNACFALAELIEADVDSYATKLYGTGKLADRLLADRATRARRAAVDAAMMESAMNRSEGAQAAADEWNAFRKALTLRTFTGAELAAAVTRKQKALHRERIALIRPPAPDPKTVRDYLEAVRVADVKIRRHWRVVKRRYTDTERDAASESIRALMEELKKTATPAPAADYFATWWEGMESMRQAITLRDTDERSIGLTRIAMKALSNATKERLKVFAWVKEAEAEAEKKRKKRHPPGGRRP